MTETNFAEAHRENSSPAEKKLILIGLAGQSCSGKNTASEILSKAGYHCIDADALSSKVFLKTEKAILALFSEDAKKKGINLKRENSPDGSATSSSKIINKKNLALLLFSDDELLKKHEAFIMPKIEAQMQEEIDKLFKISPEKPIILNAPTLHKTRFAKECKFILFIKSPFLLRLLRARRRDRLPIKNILARFSQQKDFFTQLISLNADMVIVRNFILRSRFKSRILKEIKRQF